VGFPMKDIENSHKHKALCNILDHVVSQKQELMLTFADIISPQILGGLLGDEVAIRDAKVFLTFFDKKKGEPISFNIIFKLLRRYKEPHKQHVIRVDEIWNQLKNGELENDELVRTETFTLNDITSGNSDVVKRWNTTTTVTGKTMNAQSKKENFAGSAGFGGAAIEMVTLSLRAPTAEYHVGQTVMCRDNEDITWHHGTVVSLDPLFVHVSNWTAPFGAEWDEVQLIDDSSSDSEIMMKHFLSSEDMDIMKSIDDIFGFEDQDDAGDSSDLFSGGTLPGGASITIGGEPSYISKSLTNRDDEGESTTRTGSNKRSAKTQRTRINSIRSDGAEKRDPSKK